MAEKNGRKKVFYECGNPSLHFCGLHRLLHVYRALLAELMRFPQIDDDWKRQKKIPKKRTMMSSTLSPLSSEYLVAICKIILKLTLKFGTLLSSLSSWICSPKKFTRARILHFFSYKMNFSRVTFPELRLLKAQMNQRLHRYRRCR